MNKQITKKHIQIKLVRKLKILHKYGDISNCFTNTKFNANITVTDIYFCGLSGPKLGLYYKYINIYVDRTCWYKIYWLSGSAPAVSSLLGNWHRNPIHPLFLLYTPLQIQIKITNNTNNTNTNTDTLGSIMNWHRNPIHPLFL